MTKLPPVHTLIPGKYLHKGKTGMIGTAYMMVRQDGTGFYVNSRGDRSEISAVTVLSKSRYLNYRSHFYYRPKN